MTNDSNENENISTELNDEYITSLEESETELSSIDETNIVESTTEDIE